MKINIIEEISRGVTNDIQVDGEFTKVNDSANENMDTQEFVYKSNDRNAPRLWSRVAIENEPYNWMVIQTNPTLIDKENEIYEHRVIIGELNHYLIKILMPNLSFNQFLGGDGVDQFENLYEVVARINRLVPFETVDRLHQSRIITSFYDGDKMPQNLVPMMTDKLKNLLQAHTNVPEFQFSDSESLFDAFNKVIGMTGGVLKTISTEGTNMVLDVILLDETESEVVDIKDFDGYNSFKSIENYATAGEITTNNIVDNKALYVAGADYFKHIQAGDKIIDESDAVINTEFDIYKLKKVLMKYKPDDTSDSQYNKTEDITEYVVNSDQWNILPIVPVTDEPATSNTLKYQIDTNKIGNFGQDVRESGIFGTSLMVWTELVQKFGFNDTSDLTNYVFQAEFIPMQQGNRAQINQISFVENNKETYMPVNIGGRINEANRVVKTTQNKVSRIGAEEIQKRVYHNKIEDVYPLKAKDLDTQMRIVAREIEKTEAAVIATYYLVRDINTISDYVGVNTEKWWTDVEIGKSRVRNEIYKDHVIFAPNLDFWDENDTALRTAQAEDYAVNIFKNNHNLSDNRSQNFLISSQDIPIKPIKQPIFMTGNRYLGMYLNFLNQTFVDNQIRSANISGTSRDVERGVRYTLADGKLSTMSLAFGHLKAIENDEQKNSETITNAETKLLPEAQDLINEESQALIQIGDTVEEVDELEYIVPDGGDSQSFSVKRWFYTERSLEASFSIPENKRKTRALSFKGFAFEQDDAKLTSFKLTVRGFNRFGVQTYFTSKGYTGDDIRDLWLIDGEREFGIGPSTPREMATITIKIETKYENPVEIPFKKATLSGEFGFTDLKTFYRDTTTIEDDGLFIDKNQNETLGINYQLNYVALPENYGTYQRDRIIIGDAITTNNPFLTNNDKKYVEFEVWKSSERYGIYESEKKGEKIEGAVFSPVRETSQISGQVQFDALSPRISNVTLQPNDSYAIVGVRENGKKDFMYAVNPRDDQEEVRTQDKIYIYFRHKNPLEV